MFLVFWSCSDFGDPLSNDCTKELDCAGECGGTVVQDCTGTCDGIALLSDGECTNISYSTIIQPIFNNNCTGCHGNSGGLTLTSYNDLMGSDVIDSGDGAASTLIQKIKGTLGTQMPPDQNPLNEKTINYIETWIDEGALDN